MTKDEKKVAVLPCTCGAMSHGLVMMEWADEPAFLILYGCPEPHSLRERVSGAVRAFRGHQHAPEVVLDRDGLRDLIGILQEALGRAES